MVLTWTDDAEKTMWDQILVYSHAGNVKSLLSNSIASKRPNIPNQEHVDQKALEAAFTIQQAHEYYLAARTVTVSTSPLLYYYGMLSLVKALLICNSAQLLLEDIKYHGLTKRYALVADTTPLTETLGDQQVRVSGGAFIELYRLLHGASAENLNDRIFRLSDLLKVDPELQLLFDRQFQNLSGCVSLYQSSTASDTESFVEVKSGDQEFGLRFPELTSQVTISEGYLPSHVRVTANPNFKFNAIATTYRIRSGGRVLRANPISRDQSGNTFTSYLSVEECDFMLMFLLSDCVRYKQKMWRNCQVLGDDQCYPLVGSFITNATRRFPNVFLDRLLGETHNYGSAAYMG